MTKFKFMLAASLAAVLTLACTEDPDDEDGTSSASVVVPSSSSTPSSSSCGTVDNCAPNVVTCGTDANCVLLGGNNSNLGSSLDIDVDPISTGVYKQSELTTTAVKEKIDVIFNSTSIFTPGTTEYMASTFAGIDNGALLFDVPAGTTDDNLADVFVDTDEFYTTGKNVSAGTRFGVLTSEESLALVIVESITHYDAPTGIVLKIRVSRID